MKSSGISSNAGAVAAGKWHSLAVKTDGKIWAFGENGNGQLGTTSPSVTGTPVEVTLPNSHTAKSVSAGDYFSVALTNQGYVYAWGYNGNGQVGTGSSSTSSYSTPQKVQKSTGGDLTGIVGIAVGANHALAVDNTGKVYVWGKNDKGQLGFDSSGASQYSALQLTGITAATTANSLAAGELYSLVLKSDGTAVAFGNNSYGQLGDGTSGQDVRTTPAAIEYPDNTTLSGIAAVFAGKRHSLLRKTDGSTYAFGANGAGQLGTGNTTQQTLPTLLTSFTPTIISGGSDYTVAIASGLESNMAWSFGDGGSFQLLNGDTFSVFPHRRALSVSRPSAGPLRHLSGRRGGHAPDAPEELPRKEPQRRRTLREPGDERGMVGVDRGGSVSGRKPGSPSPGSGACSRSDSLK